MLEVIKLSKQFDENWAVQEVSFVIEEGEKLVLLGTSGSGKTTCLKMINRLIEPSSGTILMHGEDLMLQKPELLRRQIGYVIQHTGLFPHYTVAQNIAIVPRLLKWPRDKTLLRSQELLALLGLDPGEYLNRLPSELSGGQRQRVGIARALAVNPPLLLMDEPFGALDPITRSQVQKDFKRIKSLSEKTLVMVTHDVFEALELGTKICLMDAGVVQQIGKPRELIFKPQNEFVKEFFKANRFQLELKAALFSEVMQFMPESDYSIPEAQENIPFFDQEEDVLTILEESSQLNQEEEVWVRLEDGRLMKTKKETVFQAFNRWKQHISK